MIIKPSNKRLNSKFEPHYNPDVKFFFKGNWKDVNASRLLILSAFSWNDAHSDIEMPKHATLVLKDKLFNCCDFRGELPTNEKIVFIECTFFQCDFAQSNLSNIKFSNCNFVETSFTLCDFGSALLLRCTWKEIGLSGTETNLHNSYITNPREFLAASFSYKKEMSILSISKNKAKFLGTKATVARDLLSSLRNNGSEGEFYEAVSVHEVSQAKSRIANSWYKKKRGSTLLHLLQLTLVWSFAQLNSWGKNPMQPLIIYMFLSFGFAVMYYFLGITDTFIRSLEKSFHIALFSGYNYEIAKHNGHGLERLLQAFQLFTSLVCYTSFAATLIGRLSRIK